MASELALLRGAVQDLQSAELPAAYRLDKENAPNRGANGENDATKTNGCDPALVRRYKALRDTYIQQRTFDAFLQSLQGYDPATNELPLPEPVTEADKAALQQRREEVLASVRGTMAEVTAGADGVRAKWAQFDEKREELARIVEGMERDERKRQLEGEAQEGAEMDDDGEEEIAEDDVALEKERLEELRARKAQLEERLRGVRAELVDVEDDCHRTKRAVNEVRATSGRKPLDWRGLTGDGNEAGGEEGGNVEYLATGAQEAEAEIAELQGRAAGLKESREFYDGIRELMEELGGVKILSSKTADEGFVLTLMLLGSHVLEIALDKSATDKDGLRVRGAKLTTPTAFAVPAASVEGGEATASPAEATMHSLSLSNASFSQILARKPSETMAVPPLDDLVAWSHSLESSSHGIRFVIVETMARLRTVVARYGELKALRERYAAQVYEVEKDAKFGGAEQEVVCSMNEGVAVALRLGADCPLIPGSVYVSELFGVGGWEEARLEELKASVAGKRCKGPVEVMGFITEEIKRRSEVDGWVVPSTPTLPRGRR
ncbi:hypothetical protein ACHAXT_002529 [Thalassiosira profunda]